MKKIMVTYRDDQDKLVSILRAKRQISPLFQLMLDAVAEEKIGWTERFKQVVAERIDCFQVSTVREKEKDSAVEQS
jgi:hypothetical protein